MTHFVGKGFRHPSGRVIALGRLMLATLFCVAIWIDVSQPTYAPMATYALLGGYLAFAATIVVVTWNNWWLDARLAGPAHAMDIILFTLLVLLTDGYHQPILRLLHLRAAVGGDPLGLAGDRAHRDPARPALRRSSACWWRRRARRSSCSGSSSATGHLVILSLILIWFGANQWRHGFYSRDEELLARPALDESPLETGLRAAMAGCARRPASSSGASQAAASSPGSSIRER